MLGKFKGTSLDHEGCGDQSDFVIPYFGTISIKRGGQLVKKMPPACSPSMVSSRSPATSAQLYTPTSEKPSQSSASDIFSQPTQSLNVTPKTSISAGTGTSAFNLTDASPFVSYDGFYNWNNINADDASATGAAASGTFNSQINDDSMNNFPLPTNNFSWQHMPMDIDQDWSWFLNDAQTTQGMGTAGGAPAPTVPLDFNAQGFPGFG